MRFRNEHLLKLRLDQGYTQKDLAAAAGIDLTTYRDYESGRVNKGEKGFEVRRLRRQNLLLSLAAALGLEDPSELLDTQPLALPSTEVQSGLWLFVLCVLWSLEGSAGASRSGEIS